MNYCQVCQCIHKKNIKKCSHETYNYTRQYIYIIEYPTMQIYRFRRLIDAANYLGISVNTLYNHSSDYTIQTQVPLGVKYYRIIETPQAPGQG